MIRSLLTRAYGLALLVMCLFVPASRRVVVFGGFGIISMGDWARALQRSGVGAVSIVPSVLEINDRRDFDLTWMDVIPACLRWLPLQIRRLSAPAIATIWMVRRARVAVGPVGGVTAFSWCGLDRLEAWLFRRKAIRTVTIPVGGDIFALSNIHDPSLRFGLQASYPDRTKSSRQTLRNLRHAEVRSDVFLAQSFYVDLVARTDVVAPQHNVVDTIALQAFATPHAELGSDSSCVRILHAANHRAFKGTQFIERAIKSLQAKGLSVELVLIDRAPRSAVLREIARASIVVDQVLFTGYALFSLEAMAMGKPVLCNLDDKSYRQLMTRYSFLDECPIVSVTPETIETQLENLCRRPELRLARGSLGRNFVARYHSYAAWNRFWSILESVEFDGDRLVKLPSEEVRRRWNGELP